MICFPNAKINLGLNVTEKRSDNFHNIETVFYPIGWSDALEIMVPDSARTDNGLADFNLNLSGITIEGKTEDNLLYKAYHLIKKIKPLPNISVYLHKALPMGAGLGGGSADAAFFINLLNQQFELNLSIAERLEIARPLGSDCAFFIHNKPVFAQEKGDVFNAIELGLSRYFIAVIYPNVHSNTKDAYSLIQPVKPTKSITEIIKQPIETWKSELVNDFENSIFTKYPVVEKTKQDLYNLGAIYSSLSGSGSAVFGLFDKLPVLTGLDHFPNWIGKMK